MTRTIDGYNGPVPSKSEQPTRCLQHAASATLGTLQRMTFDSLQIAMKIAPLNIKWCLTYATKSFPFCFSVRPCSPCSQTSFKIKCSYADIIVRDECLCVHVSWIYNDHMLAFGLSVSANMWLSMGLLSDTKNNGLRMRRECQERFPRYRLQRKPSVSDLGMDHGTCRDTWRDR